MTVEDRDGAPVSPDEQGFRALSRRPLVCRERELNGHYGATALPGGGVHFRVWAPDAKSLALQLAGCAPLPMTRAGEDFELFAPEARPGDTYSFVFEDGRLRPDPVSRSQPNGVHGPSQIVDPAAFAWSDQDWKGLALSDYIFYELHIGTFTPEGTFASAIAKLPHLKDLGITAVELMPVGEFPGARNWGYDQVDLYAPHSAYGGPDGLKILRRRVPSSGPRGGAGCRLQSRRSRKATTWPSSALISPINTGRPGAAP